ncbi:tetratricopeptide repeat protein [Bailinhaonella thermotolerans]|uniref:Co-chaperone YbbN n=1 Tax=Bailinhaonella thermotolerans TaxID=1070861 RepID=A0A3A4AYU2_9ACTN|nr:tetratricopeptide repeat protein [Bailinhaonella thermotolerans]RJL24532.1 co-chaperone YbbN [Bailinhaonella thermotolerans]
MRPSDFTRPGSLYGAVDLGARKAAAESAARRQAAASAPGQGGAGSAVIDVTDATFNTDVIERSMRTPVLLDLWATWCEPCKQLSPVLEKLAAEAAGKWVLAKVDVDANPQIAQALRVQSIPTVFAIFQGQPVSGFQGAIPEQQIRQWLDQLFEALAQYLPPDAGEPGAEAEAAPQLDEDAYAAEEAIARGDMDSAAAAYRRLLERNPGDEAAKAGLAQVELVKRASSYNAADVRRRAEDPADVQAQCQAADLDVAEGDVEAAFNRLIAAVKRTSGEDRDTVRKHLLGLFEVLPQGDPRVATARRALTSALF